MTNVIAKILEVTRYSLLGVALGFLTLSPYAYAYSLETSEETKTSNVRMPTYAMLYFYIPIPQENGPLYAENYTMFRVPW